MQHLVAPYGGEVLELMAANERVAELRELAREMPSLDLSWRQICQLEMLMNGAYSPLTGFMGREDMHQVLADFALTDGTRWPLPLMLAVSEKAARAIQPGQTVALRDGEGFMPAVLHVSEVWVAEPEEEDRLARSVGMPLCAPLAQAGEFYVAGRVEGVAMPPRHDFPTLRSSPRETRELFARRGWRRVLAYQPGQPMHRPQVEFVRRAAAENQAHLFLQPTAGSDPVLEASHFTLVRACQALLPRFPSATTHFALSSMLPLLAGPRETLLRAIVARNYGCELLVVGGETQLAGTHRRGTDVMGSLSVHATFAAFLNELAVNVVPFPRMVYLEDLDEYLPQEQVKVGTRVQVMGGQELIRRLTQGLKIPDWFTYPEVVSELRHSFPPRSEQGLTVFFTGLSGAGKSTMAKALAVKLMEMGGRRVTLLDGDIVRKNLSSELGFSRAHRDLNIRRIGFVASEITRHGGIAICAPIAPYRQTRRDVRAMIEPWGGFIEVHVSTPIEICESRDRKGLYAKARAGQIAEFTGVSAPYEVPEQAELILDTASHTVEEAVQKILLKLELDGYLA